MTQAGTARSGAGDSSMTRIERPTDMALVLLEILVVHASGTALQVDVLYSYYPSLPLTASAALLVVLVLLVLGVLS